MAVRYSAAVREAMLNAIETTIQASPKLNFYTGSAPSGGCSAPATGTLVASLDLGTTNSGDWMSQASTNGSNVTTKAKHPSSTWTAQATAPGTNVVGYYRIYDSSGTDCHEQGTVSAAGGGGDMILDNTSVAQNQTITVVTKTITAGNG